MIEVSLNITTLGYGFIVTLRDRDTSDLVFRLGRMAQHAGLDFAGITDERGQTICRIGPHSIPGKKNQSLNPIVTQALEKKTLASGAIVLSEEFLNAENPQLAERASRHYPDTRGDLQRKSRDLGTHPSPVSLFSAEGRFSECSMVEFSEQDEKIVTRAGTVFRNEEYKGRSIGRATIFSGMSVLRPMSSKMEAGQSAPGGRRRKRARAR
jgi:hypothetical protein